MDKNLIILTLTTSQDMLTFGAMQKGENAAALVRLAPDMTSIEAYLNVIADGFAQVKARLPQAPAAISFAFPGPADYPNGIIGDVANMPLFRGGVPLGAFLKHRFGLPTFINNNGDLFTYGEAMAGLLPQVNGMLEQAGSLRRYRNLLGIMLGKGAGGGLVTGGKMNTGDNGASTEIWCMRSKKPNDTIFEDSVNGAAVVRFYKNIAATVGEFSATDIRDIALGNRDGNSVAAQQAFDRMGEALGAGLADILCVIDGLVVLGGAVADCASLFMPRMIEELNDVLNTSDGEPVVRELTCFNLADKRAQHSFLLGSNRKIVVPQTDGTTVDYDPVKRTGIGVSALGTEKAIALGAYYYALDRLK
jgi:glucokinase